MTFAIILCIMHDGEIVHDSPVVHPRDALEALTARRVPHPEQHGLAVDDKLPETWRLSTYCSDTEANKRYLPP